MTNRFYKVFVSSTYEDLRDERHEVFDALMKCNCFPMGMEHFPSSNLRSLELIKRYIDECDYFCLVSAAVYGSLVPDQPSKISFVEWEYEYAKSRMPCYSFLHADTGEIVGAKQEKQNPKLLTQFHKKLKNDDRNVAFYKSAENLNAEVLHAFQNAPRDSPAIGWVRGDSVPFANEIIGAWKLIKSNVAAWGTSEIIKVFSANEFIWWQIDGSRKTQFICGYYEVDGYFMSIRETARRASIGSLVDEEQEYEIEIDGNVLKTSGTRSTGGYIEEEFQRLDLSGGFEILKNV